MWLYQLNVLQCNHGRNVKTMYIKTIFQSTSTALTTIQLKVNMLNVLKEDCFKVLAYSNFFDYLNV